MLKEAIKEKEAYAIFYSVKKLNYLLRDAKFLVRTDHRNLLYLNNENARVTRWKMEIQEYDFNIEHVPGVKNAVADQLWRMVNGGDEIIPSAGVSSSAGVINQSDQQLLYASSLVGQIPEHCLNSLFALGC
jgi:hypothetical protein